MPKLVLTDCHILYTRAAEYYPAFAAAITPLGGIIHHQPMIATRATALPPAACLAIRESNTLIFTSAAAVAYFHPYQALRAAQSRIIAIGPATAQALSAHDIPTHLIAPAPHTSESLLSVFQPEEERICIITGQQSRPHLANVLGAHNKLTLCPLYERYNPTPRWQLPLAQRLDAIFIASQDTLKHLIHTLPSPLLARYQQQSQLISLAPRISQAAEAAGFQHIHTASRAQEAAQITKLIEIWSCR